MEDSKEIIIDCKTHEFNFPVAFQSGKCNTGSHNKYTGRQNNNTSNGCKSKAYAESQQN